MEQHFLVVAFYTQSHINPALSLAKRLATTSSAAVTFSTTISAHLRMFPGLSTSDEDLFDGLISYIPHPDGDGSKTLSTVIRSLADRGRPVTCVIHTISEVGNVAREHGIPSVLYWVQPATVFAVFYHYFHGYESVILSNVSSMSSVIELPGLPPLQVREIPTILTTPKSDETSLWVFKLFQDAFQLLDRQKTIAKPMVLVNTFEELEPDAFASIGDELQLMSVGPAMAYNEGDLFRQDEKRYMDWLDSMPAKSVVYVAFGSLVVLKKEQVKEIRRGLREIGRPYLWVLRKDNQIEAATGEAAAVEEEEEVNGMVVEWCSQWKVLCHEAVGCFVTHCGWNSTLDAVASGVPTVGVPQWMDQVTNARLVEIWGTGVRAELGGSGGVLEAEELRRCVEMVMGEGEKGEEVRRRAEIWREKAKEALDEAGSSPRNLRAFLQEISCRFKNQGGAKKP